VVISLVMLGSFHRVEHLLMVSALFMASVGAGHADCPAALHEILVPTGGTRTAFVVG
jgi:hypothetical protein